MDSATAPAAVAGGKTGKKGDQILLGKYELGRLLGQGTFAKVYHAVSLSDGSSVAVKVLDKPSAGGDSSGGVTSPCLLLREVLAMRRLSHPNILRLHEVLATRSRVYLVMDYAPGGDLLSHLSRLSSRRLSEASTRRIFLQLISALRYCHRRGVSHRDVKPQNLLIGRDGSVKLSDFGLSALPEQLRPDGRLTTACGTPAFAAPEVMRRRAYDGPKADAWSCGVILFVLLAGFLPFDDSNLPLMYKKMQRRDYEFPSWFSPAARRLISRLLDPNPDTRLSVEALSDHPWFKRSLSLDSQLSLMDLGPSSCQLNTAHSTPALNAFDIISLSSGLDLSGLFEDGKKRNETMRFTSIESVQRILGRIDEAGLKLGYLVGKRKKEKNMDLWRFMPGLIIISVELSEVAAPLLLIELRVETGDGIEDGELGFKWEELKGELGDVVKHWHGRGDG